jgi:hypothetical protein
METPHHDRAKRLGHYERDRGKQSAYSVGKPTNKQYQNKGGKRMNFAELQIGGIQPKVADLANQLLIIEPIEYKANIDTVHGMTDAIEVNVTNLDTGQMHDGILFFNVALKNALKNKVGQKVLARIGQGTAKPGKSAPWILIDATSNPADLAKANSFVAAAPAKPAAAPATVADPKQVVTADALSPEVVALLAQLGAKPI